jgi:hypothetical protein
MSIPVACRLFFGGDDKEKGQFVQGVSKVQYLNRRFTGRHLWDWLLAETRLQNEDYFPRKSYTNLVISCRWSFYGDAVWDNDLFVPNRACLFEVCFKLCCRGTDYCNYDESMYVGEIPKRSSWHLDTPFTKETVHPVQLGDKESWNNSTSRPYYGCQSDNPIGSSVNTKCCCRPLFYYFRLVNRVSTAPLRFTTGLRRRTTSTHDDADVVGSCSSSKQPGTI